MGGSLDGVAIFYAIYANPSTVNDDYRNAQPARLETTHQRARDMAAGSTKERRIVR